MATEQPSTDAVVAGWWEYQRLLRGNRAERTRLEVPLSWPSAAADAVSDSVDAGGDAALDLVAALIRAAPDSEGLGLVGAGPLENLVHAHGSALVDGIETLARREPGFAEALAAVWLEHGAVDAPVEQRLARWISVTG